MIELTREIRLAWTAELASADLDAVANGYAHWPSTDAAITFLAVRCTLQGEIDSGSGYLCNVKAIDRLVRDLARRFAAGFPTPPPALRLVRQWAEAAASAVPPGTRLRALEIAISPFLSYRLELGESPVTIVSQQFEFSASHRLHNPQLSEDENRRLFGKCNHPHGHGHNYVLEVSWQAEEPFSLRACESAVKAALIDRWDHRHLNAEIPPFDRVNPTVENIAVQAWDLLAPSSRTVRGSFASASTKLPRRGPTTPDRRPPEVRRVRPRRARPSCGANRGSRRREQTAKVSRRRPAAQAA